ncbi:hypothetical protein RvY_03405-2 [Ramazzottius varieornatus]|uniref:Eukaryotic translation initiation factor 3 subunit C N-terminal domain-containing protein n=1 Tax=Ramazzottius varieornatus TaxID=947166 RepID=A0A1D1UN01_RAMVA|nr:hypothetical protein RvY_03405-2 [Ramazzottius varieornatus]
MSRFFAGKDSDTETESEVSDEEHVQPVAKSKAYQGDFSDDDEETKRVVRTAKDKRFEEIRNVIKNVKNSKKIKDVGKVLEEFDQLTRAFAKSQKVIEKEGVPVFYVRTLVDLEDFVNQSWAEKATLSKLNIKALGSLRSKFRKYVKDFEGQMASFRLNPVASEEENVQGEEEEEEDEDETTDEEGGMTTAKKAKGAKAKKGSDEMDEDEDEDMDWDTDSETSETDSEDEERYKNDPAARFLKRPGDEEKQREKEKQKKKTVGNRPGHMRQRRAEVDEEGWTTMTDKPKLFSKDAEINHGVVLKKLGEIMSQRGKKSTDRQEQIELIEELRVVARRAGLGEAIELKLMLSLISSIFDYNPNMATNMKAEVWRRLLETMGQLVKFLNEHSHMEVLENIADDEENVSDPTLPYRVHGLPLALIERMDDEFTRILQNTDAHSPDYVENLKNEAKVVAIIEGMQVSHGDIAPTSIV